MKPIFCVASALILSCAAYAQQPPAPPIKMGLWETSTTMKSGKGPQTMKSQVCMTPKTWREGFASSPGCGVKSLKQDAKSLSMVFACTLWGKDVATSHVQLTFPSPEKLHGTAHVEMPGQEPSVMDTTFEGVFKGADCKGLAPGKSREVH